MADRVGQQLGNYRLTRLLGRGGFADVITRDFCRTLYNVYTSCKTSLSIIRNKVEYVSELVSSRDSTLTEERPTK